MLWGEESAHVDALHDSKSPTLQAPQPTPEPHARCKKNKGVPVTGPRKLRWDLRSGGGMGVLGEKIGLRGRASLFLEKLYVGNKNHATWQPFEESDS